MVDRTTNTTFDGAGSDVTFITGVTNASDNDTFVVPRKIKTIVLQSSGDDDGIATAAISSDGMTVTIGLIDDAGSAIGTDADLHFIARRDPQ